MGKLVIVLIFTFSISACCGLLASPEKTARQYLQRGTEGTDVSDLVEDGCEDPEILSVSAVKIFGVPIKADEIEVTLEEQSADRAIVSYTLTGSVEQDGEVQTGPLTISGGLNVGEMTKSGELEIVKQGMSWKIACR